MLFQVLPQDTFFNVAGCQLPLFPVAEVAVAELLLEKPDDATGTGVAFGLLTLLMRGILLRMFQ